MSVYETSITNPMEFYKDLSEQLEKYNQELKKENESLRQLQCTFLGTGCKRKMEEYESQQKEFIEWLEQNIENEGYCYLAQNPSERCRKDVLKKSYQNIKKL